MYHVDEQAKKEKKEVNGIISKQVKDWVLLSFIVSVLMMLKWYIFFNDLLNFPQHWVGFGQRESDEGGRTGSSHLF